jgi:hypothetical protein
MDVDEFISIDFLWLAATITKITRDHFIQRIEPYPTGLEIMGGGGTGRGLKH